MAVVNADPRTISGSTQSEEIKASKAKGIIVVDVVHNYFVVA